MIHQDVKAADVLIETLCCRDIPGGNVGDDTFDLHGSGLRVRESSRIAGGTLSRRLWVKPGYQPVPVRNTPGSRRTGDRYMTSQKCPKRLWRRRLLVFFYHRIVPSRVHDSTPMINASPVKGERVGSLTISRVSSLTVNFRTCSEPTQ